MRLDDADWDDIEAVLTGAGETLAIVAPNFEERSLYFAERLLALHLRLRTQGTPVKKLNWLVLTFQGVPEGSLLDGVKGTHANRGWTAAASEATGEVIHRLVPYPVEAERMRGLLRTSLRLFPTPDDVIIDFTSVPRPILTSLMEGLASGTLLSRNVSPYLAYSWARSYPEAAAFEDYGRPKGSFSDSTVEELLEGIQHLELVVTTGTSIHEAHSVLGELEQRRGTFTSNVRVVNFINRANLAESWRQLTNHQSLLTDATNQGWRVEYAFTVRHVLDHVNRAWVSATDVSKDGRGPVGLLVAPFGPKPISVGVQLMMADLRQVDPAARMDVLRTSESQYLSVYSLGASDCSLFRCQDIIPRAES
ncbi:hypothetical protein [Nocardioides sp. 503]|uniref:hypothetical protein n=1 Tax=Nocardioides sp. 503 TaxID=2508326 RepID=UPI00106FCD06|nr:hypothetical protein [Nocardioides sp. 503]